MSEKWTFQQLGGERKKLELEGWSAPFGRPRQKPIFDEVVKVNVQTTRYPGYSGPPTRHDFGSHWEDMELSGRWMTKALVAKTSESFAAEWTQFVRDAQRVRISWGNIVSYVGFIEELRLARESEHELVWKMKILVDANDEILNIVTVIPPTKFAEVMADLTLFLRKSKRELESTAPDMTIDILEAIDNIAATANAPSAALARIVGQLDDMEKMTFTTLQHFRQSIAGIATSLVGLRDVVLHGMIDSFLVVRTAEADLRWLEYQLTFDVESSEILASLRELDRRAELQARGEVSKLITAIEGDTWETISTRASGGIDQVDTIRGANGIRYGERPVPGETYLVP